MENTKLYTGNGDKGYTKTAANFRIAKADAVIELLGALDEFYAALGVAKNAVSDKDLAEDIELVRGRISPIKDEVGGGKTAVTKKCVSVVEGMVDGYQSRLGISDKAQPADKTAQAADLYMAYSILRRAERCAARAGQFGRIKPELQAYLNRLCDLVYCFACAAQNEPSSEKSGENTGISNTSSADSVKTNNSDVLSYGGQCTLTLAMAKRLSEEIEKQAADMGLRVVVAINDSGANPVLLHSMDDAFIASSGIAQNKAYTSVALKMSTLSALEMSRGGALDGLVSTADNRIILLGGGEPLKSGGTVVGGLGVSGGTAMQDAALAQFGAELFARLYS